MKSSIIFSILTFCLTNQLTAQSFFEGEQESADKSYFGDFIAADGSSFYTFGAQFFGPELPTSSGAYQIRKYNIASLQLEGKKSISEFKFQGQKTWFREIIRNKSGIHVFFESYNRSGNTKHLLHRKIDVSGFLTEPKIIAAQSVRNIDNNVFSIALSRDSSKVMVYADKESNSSDAIPEITVLDNELEALWSTPLKLSSQKERIKPMSYTVSNTGNVFLLGLTEDGRIDERDFKNNNYLIYKISAGNSQVIQDLSQNSQLIFSGCLQADIQGQLLFFAFVGEPSNDDIKKATVMYINQNDGSLKTQENLNLSSQGSALLENKNNLFASIANARGLQRMSFDYFFEWSDGSVTILAEQYYQHGFSSDQQSSLEAQNLLAITIGKEGNLISSYLLPKSADVVAGALSNPRYYSYLAIKKNNRIHVLYNTHGDNVEKLTTGEKIEHGFGTFKMDIALIEAALSPSSGIEYSVINHVKTMNIKKVRFLDTKSFLQINPGELIGLYMPALYTVGFSRISLTN